MKNYRFLGIFALFLVFAIYNLSAQNNFLPHDRWSTDIPTLRGGGVTFDFLGNYVIKSIRDNNTYNNILLGKGEFKIEYVNKVPFLVINWLESNSDRYMMLANDEFMLLYDEVNSDPVFKLYHFYSRYYEDFTDWHFRHIGSVKNIKASSSLTENNITYSPENINIQQNSVWAEGVPGYGINERITFEQVQSQTIYISIGYVSYLKPNLYTENSRPKKIRIIDEYHPPFDVILEDTPAFQMINGVVGKEITIEILEVYPGTKYKDTCINSIMYEFRQ